MPEAMAAAFSAALAAAGGVGVGGGGVTDATFAAAQQQQALMAAALAFEAQRHGYAIPFPNALFGGGGGGGAAPPRVPGGRSGGGDVSIDFASAVSAQREVGIRQARAAQARTLRGRSVGGGSGDGGGGGGGGQRPKSAKRAPSSSNFDPASTAANFQDRVYAWASAKREESVRKAQEVRAAQLAACTFKPSINETSRAVAEASGRAPSRATEIYDRLYQQAVVRQAARTPGRGLSMGRGASLSPGAHGADASVKGPPDSPPDPECTFAPRVNTNYEARPVRARYLDPTPARGARGADAAAAAADYTFQPKTNPVRASAMPAAAVYVQAPIYERLARTHTRAQVERERVVAADLERLEVAHRERLGVAMPDFAAAGEDAKSANAELSEEAQRRLAGFLERQAHAAEKKEANINKVMEETAPKLQPALNPLSLKIIEEKEGGASFLTRLHRSRIEREAEVRSSAATRPAVLIRRSPVSHASPAPPHPPTRSPLLSAHAHKGRSRA
jgi:hypothetical protein